MIFLFWYADLLFLRCCVRSIIFVFVFVFCSCKMTLLFSGVDSVDFIVQCKMGIAFSGVDLCCLLVLLLIEMCFPFKSKTYFRMKGLRNMVFPCKKTINL